MLQVVRVMPLPDEIRNKVLDPRGVSVSVLERFIESKTGRKAHLVSSLMATGISLGRLMKRNSRRDLPDSCVT